MLNIRQWKGPVLALIADAATSPVLHLPIFMTTNIDFLDLTNMANAEQFLDNSTSYIFPVDLTEYSEYRLFVRIGSFASTTNNPRLYAKYASPFSTTAGDYSHLSGAEVSVSISSSDTSLVRLSDWTALEANAKADVWVTLMQNGGDGVTDPRLLQVALQFRQ